MKNITKQYQDLLEGKMSKANFMVNVRRDFPQWISPVNSFQDAVNILKSKRILVESNINGYSSSSPIGGETQVDARHIAKMWNSLSDEAREDIITAIGAFDDVGEVERLAGMDFNAMMNALPNGADTKKVEADIQKAAEEESMIAQMQSKQAGEFDPNNPGKYSTLEREELNEAVQKPEGSYKRVTGKDQYELFAEIDKANPYEFSKGIQIEMGMQYLPTPNAFTNTFNPETLAKAARKVLKNLKKDPAYYTNSISAVSEKRSGLKQDPKELNVKADGAIKVKGYNNPSANTQTNLGKSERAKGRPDGVKEMKPSKKGMGGIQTMKTNGKLPKGVELMKESTEAGEYTFNGELTDPAKLKSIIGHFEIDVETDPGQTVKTTITSATKSTDEIKKAVDSITGFDKMGKLKEYIRERVKKALREKIDPKDLDQAKQTGDIIEIPAGDTQALSAARSKKVNITVYK